MNEIKQKLYKFSHSEIFLYLFCGVLTTILSLIVFFGSYNLFVSINLINFQIMNRDANWVIANLLSFCLSTIFAYYINKIFVFNNTDYETATIVKELAKFFAGRILGYILFDIGLMAIFIYVFNVNVTISKLISCVFIVIFNYIVSKLIVFVKSNKM